MADLWSAPYFVLLKKSQGSSRENRLEILSPSEDDSDSLLELLSLCEDDCESLLELLSPCEEPLLGLIQINDGTDRRRVPLQDEDHPENDPHLVPGFPRLFSGMFLERLLSASVSMG